MAAAENTVQGGQRSRRISGVRSSIRRSASRKFIGADRSFVCGNIVSAGGNVCADVISEEIHATRISRGRHDVPAVLGQPIGGVVQADIADNLRAALPRHG